MTTGFFGDSFNHADKTLEGSSTLVQIKQHFPLFYGKDFAACMATFENVQAQVQSALEDSNLSRQEALLSVGGVQAFLIPLVQYTYWLASGQIDVQEFNKMEARVMQCREKVRKGLYDLLQSMRNNFERVVLLGYPNLVSPCGGGLMTAELAGVVREAMHLHLCMVQETINQVRGVEFFDIRPALAAHEGSEYNGDFITSPEIYKISFPANFLGDRAWTWAWHPRKALHEVAARNIVETGLLHTWVPQIPALAA